MSFFKEKSVFFFIFVELVSCCPFLCMSLSVLRVYLVVSFPFPQEKRGSQCLELENCGHAFCRDCLTSYLTVCITGGNVEQLSCPDPDCDTELLLSEVCYLNFGSVTVSDFI